MRLSDKFIPYFSVTPSKKFMKLFERAQVKNVLISYHYIRQDLSYSIELMKRVQDWGGCFMVDSGIFSFAMDKNFDVAGFDWVGYTQEYVDFLYKYKDYIYQACNLDADTLLGHEDVVKANKQYFEPLEKDLTIFYVAHKNVGTEGDLGIFKEYCKKYRCVAVNESMSKYASDIYQIARQNNTVIHGLAWTKPTLLKECPMFSVDSSSWVNYQKYGATVFFDGVNFNQYDKDNKPIRRTLKKYCDKYGVLYEEFCTEKNPNGSHNDDEGLTFSLNAWRETLEGIGKIALHKLKATVEDIADGKPVLIGLKPEPELTKKNNLKEYVENSDMELKDAVPSTYEVNTDGSLSIQVNQRSAGDKVSVADFNRNYSSSMFCNNCFIKDKCPKFLLDSACAFEFAPTEHMQDPLAVMEHLISTQTERVNRAMLMEKMEGGLPNKTYSQEVLLLARLNAMKSEMLMMAQMKGVRLTQTTVEVIENGVPAGGGGSFRDILLSAMKGDKG
jgi:hypothetical protein